MPQFITPEMLDQAFAKFRKELQLDLGSMEYRLESKNEKRAELLEEQITQKFSQLQSSVDHYLHRTETWHDEQDVLASQHDRLQNSLIRKNVITETDIVP